MGLALTILGLAASSGATGPARLLWQTELPPPVQRPSEVYEGVNSIAAANGVVVAAGWVDGSGQADMAIRAYERRSGAPLWQEKLDFDDGSDAAYSVAAHGSLATVIGKAGLFTAAERLVVRTYDARTGTLRWEDRGDGTAIDLRSGVVAVAGALARAWDARSGERLWTHVCADGDGFADVAIRGGLVIAVGSAVGEGGDRELLVRALDRRTGAIAWEDVYDAAGYDDAAYKVVAWGNVVLVGGVVHLSEDAQGLVVRAYRRTTGEILWDDVLEGSVWRVAVGGGGRTAVLAGGLDGKFVVHAYDARNGQMLWSDGSVDGAANVAAEAVAVGRGTVVAVGFNGDFVVRAYDRRDGSLRWADEHDEGGREENAQSVALDGRTVVAGGYVGRKASLIYFAVRAYDL